MQHSLDTSTIAMVLAVITFLWKCIEFFVTHNNDAKNRQFEAYHRLIKELVQPSEDGKTYVDRQCAAVFEVVRFKQYEPVTIRILTGLRDDWKAQGVLHPRLARELELALSSLGVR